MAVLLCCATIAISGATSDGDGVGDGDGTISQAAMLSLADVLESIPVPAYEEGGVHMYATAGHTVVSGTPFLRQHAAGIAWTTRSWLPLLERLQPLHAWRQRLHIVVPHYRVSNFDILRYVAVQSAIATLAPELLLLHLPVGTQAAMGYQPSKVDEFRWLRKLLATEHTANGRKLSVVPVEYKIVGVVDPADDEEAHLATTRHDATRHDATRHDLAHAHARLHAGRHCWNDDV